MTAALASLGGVVGEGQVGGPEGACRLPRETCTARRQDVRQAVGGQTDVSRQDRSCINFSSSGGSCGATPSNGNINDNGNASLRPRAVTLGSGIEQSVNAVENDSKPSGEPPKSASVFHASGDNIVYARRGVCVVDWTCPRSVDECKTLRHNVREGNKKTLSGGT